MTKNSSPEEILSLIHKAKFITIVTHTHPDPDAYGSLCGLAQILKRLGKKVCLVNESAPATNLSFFPLSDDVQSTFPKDGESDCVIVLDCGDSNRVGDSLKEELLNRAWKIINIDHHQSNDFFGTLNFVFPGGSSTCELIYKLFEDKKNIVTKEIAESLFFGMMADTGSFRYSSASAETYSVASQLIELGAQPDKIGKVLYGQLEVSALKLQSEALLHTEFLHDGQIGIVTVSQALLDKHNADLTATESLSEKVRDLKGVEVSAAIRQYEDMWKVSLRSSCEEYNVAEVAKVFGGGGHKPAAAFRWKQDLDQLKVGLTEELVKLFSDKK